MSMPSIPDMKPEIGINVDDSINLLISSIAMEEMGLSHIINAEAEKLQYVLGTLDTTHDITHFQQHSINDLLRVNNSIDKTLREVLRNQMILHMKFEDTISFYYNSRKKDDETAIRVGMNYGE
ncbi:MAG: hypothetical protein ACRC41_16415 [Sarcina sp.]